MSERIAARLGRTPDAFALAGRTRLNAAGDRASGNYDFWAVCRVGNTLAWGKAAVYTGGQARRVSGCDQQPR